MTRVACVALAAPLAFALGCSSGNFNVASNATGDGGGPGADTAGGSGDGAAVDGLLSDGAPPPECRSPVTDTCAVDGGHASIWPTNTGSLAAPLLQKGSSLAFEMTLLLRGRVDKFEVPMQIEGSMCTGNVTLVVKVETCPGVFVELRRMNRPASDMRPTSGNYWWLNQTAGTDLPWFKALTRYRFELLTDSTCNFRIFMTPGGVSRDVPYGFKWYSRAGAAAWKEEAAETVASPWFQRCR